MDSSAPKMKFETNSQVNSYYTYDRLCGIVDYIKSKFTTTKFVSPDYAIICGSGLSEIADIMTSVTLTFKFRDLPGFPAATVSGHRGEIIFGEIGHKPVVCMVGRFHPYEGHCPSLCAVPVKLFKLLGAKYLILTAATGALNPTYNVGDIVILYDQISLPTFGCNNPLIGQNDERLGPRFPATNKIYPENARLHFQKVLEGLDLDKYSRNGIYINACGPTYETPAEVRALRILGGDVVGMSCTHEAIAAVHVGLPVLGIALATNKCIGDYKTNVMPHHSEVLQVADQRGKDICRSVMIFIETFNLNSP
ncbi:hypothetical protein ACOME3_007636 [Neoechinorhynchus agilis]